MSSIAPRIDVQSIWLRDALSFGREPATPFPWQSRLLGEFLREEMAVRSLDIPTGLGKTAVMAIWLVARALRAPALPRRLVYVVDRRAVVDQATEVAIGLRDWVASNPDVRRALGLADDQPLPISTLRGQHVDNREWLEDPSRPAIVVGTVDMIGSRLLFEGYGISRKMRPYHAGLLGNDTLVALDEAHLVPPFEKLLETMVQGAALLGPRENVRSVIPAFKLLALSATGRSSAEGSFTLDEADLTHEVVARRLRAPKRLRVKPLGGELSEVLAREAWDLAGKGELPIRCIVFCNKREDAVDVSDHLARLARGDKKAGLRKVDIQQELLVGARRVYEREQAMGRLRALGFIAGKKTESLQPSFVIATSAGEVGVDLDADHMVSDLVAWERMVQRLGRVNRRGDGDASVVVLTEPPPEEPKKVVEAMKRLEADKKDAAKKRPAGKVKTDHATVAKYESGQAEKAAWPKPLARLPKNGSEHDASPGALRDLKLRAATDPSIKAILDAATTKPPLRPALTRALSEAWSMTSLREHTGRPAIAPWLRGWTDEELQTSIIWRKHLPVRHGAVSDSEIEAFFEAAPPHVSEILETETFRVVEWLVGRAPRVERNRQAEAAEASGLAIADDDVVAFVLSGAGDLERRIRIANLREAADDKRHRDWLVRDLSGRSLVVDRRLGGLLSSGLVAAEEDMLPHTLDDGEPWLAADPPVIRFRVRSVGRDDAAIRRDAGWRPRQKFVVDRSAEGEPLRWLSIEKWRHDAATEEDRSSGRAQLLDDHQSWTEERARALGKRLGLPDRYIEMLAIAGRLHDEGKRALRWQRASSAPAAGVYAKTQGPFDWRLLDGYRHEFGSLPIAEKDPLLASLASELKELALHLIASHHGFARPIISTNGCDEPPCALAERAREVALRFVQLQKEWGPWGLAWWESLLRAADQQASRDNERREDA